MHRVKQRRVGMPKEESPSEDDEGDNDDDEDIQGMAARLEPLLAPQPQEDASFG